MSRRTPVPSRRVPVWIIVLVLAATPSAEFAAAGTRWAPAARERADALLRSGAFAEAISELSRLVERSARRGERSETVQLLLALANAQQWAGRFPAAAETIERASALAGALRDPGLAGAVEVARGMNLALLHRWDDARASYDRALSHARRHGDLRGQAVALSGLAGLDLASSDFAAASVKLRESAELAGQAGDRVLRAEALASAADSAARAGDAAAHQQLLAASKAVAELPDSFASASALLKIGDAYQRLGPRGAAHAYERYRDALAVARRIKNQRLVSYAHAKTSELYEAQGRLEDALTLARRATFAAQQVGAPDLQYRWQWRTARLLSQLQRDDEALESYRAAAATLARIRADVALGFGNAIPDQADGAGASAQTAEVFRELADVLLRRAATAPGTPAESADLRAAREAMESLKAAELEDYFKTECATRAARDVREIDDVIDPGTAVVYFVPLPRRTEILVSLSGGRIHRVSAGVGRDELGGWVRELRGSLEDRTSHAYKLSGKRVHDALLALLLPLLREEQIRTIVVVAEAELRAVPFGALWDGDSFLVEDYAVAVVPGLTLVPSRRAAVPAQGDVLAAGVSQAQAGFSALHFVPVELAHLRELYRASVLADAACTHERLRETLDAHEFAVVHLATHGEFDADSAGTFLLLHGDRLTLDDLARLIQPNQYRGAPVELLTLSACQTATGKSFDRAALGLAGVALKAGARSALATLWYVNDLASAELTSRFYEVLRNDPSRSKAYALQQAQLMMLRDPRFKRFRHPCYWSPYLLVGDWK